MMTKKRIAYIGAGPATLYSIQTLLKLGEYDVEVFDMNDDGKAHTIVDEVPEGKEDETQDAADSCPVTAISVD